MSNPIFSSFPSNRENNRNSLSDIVKTCCGGINSVLLTNTGTEEINFAENGRLSIKRIA